MSKIHTAIPQIMAEVGAISKTRKNAQQGYQFRGIDDAYAAFQPAFIKHGVFVMPEVQTTTREERQTKSGGALIYTTMTVRHTFYADDGSSLSAVTVGEAMDSGDKSSNKAMSAAMKYALLEVFCVPVEGDNDTENHSPAPAPINAPKATPATAKPVPAATPATATDKHRQRMIAGLKEHGFSEADVLEYGRKSGALTATQLPEEWPLAKVPTSKAEFDNLTDKLTDFLNGGAAVANK